MTAAHVWCAASELGNSFSRERPGVEEALAHVTAERGKLVELLVSLDPLGHDRHVERMGHRREGADDLAVASTSRPTCSTKVRSIFKMSTGRCWRRIRVEYPVPKSSRASRTPMADSAGGVSLGAAVLADEVRSR